MPADEVQALYRQAHKLIELDAEPARAKALLDQVLASHPDHARALFDRGMVALRESRVDDAVRDLESAAALAPKDLRILGARCVALVAAGRTEKGLDACDDTVALGADADANAFTARGQARLLAGQDEGALADFEEALHWQPNHARARYGQGLAQQRLGREEEGGRNMARALKALPAQRASSSAWRRPNPGPDEPA